MVIYAGGSAEASTISQGWHGWMHYRTDVPPTEESYAPQAVGEAAPAEPDRHGRRLPAGREPAQQGQRPSVTGDYDAWSPE
jgi:NADH:ubiquinone oxidoreductase subunit